MTIVKSKKLWQKLENQRRKIKGGDLHRGTSSNEGEWKRVIDFTKIKKGGLKINSLLKKFWFNRQRKNSGNPELLLLLNGAIYLKITGMHIFLCNQINNCTIAAIERNIPASKSITPASAATRAVAYPISTMIKINPCSNLFKPSAVKWNTPDSSKTVNIKQKKTTGGIFAWSIFTQRLWYFCLSGCQNFHKPSTGGQPARAVPNFGQVPKSGDSIRAAIKQMVAKTEISPLPIIPRKTHAVNAQSVVFSVGVQSQRRFSQQRIAFNRPSLFKISSLDTGASCWLLKNNLVYKTCSKVSRDRIQSTNYLVFCFKFSKWQHRRKNNVVRIVDNYIFQAYIVSIGPISR